MSDTGPPPGGFDAAHAKTAHDATTAVTSLVESVVIVCGVVDSVRQSDASLKSADRNAEAVDTALEHLTAAAVYLEAALTQLLGSLKAARSVAEASIETCVLAADAATSADPIGASQAAAHAQDCKMTIARVAAAAETIIRSLLGETGDQA